MAPAHSSFAEGDDNLMVEGVVQLLNRGVDVDDVFRMVRSSDWDWENEAIPLNIVNNRNLYELIVKLAEGRGRRTFASSSYKNRFKRIMDDGQAHGIDYVIGKRAHVFPNENAKNLFRELFEKWHTERSRRSCWGRKFFGAGGGGMSASVSLPLFNMRDDDEQLSDGEATQIMEDEEDTGGNQPVLNQPPEPEVLLNSTERQAIIKTIAELLGIYSHRDVFDMVMHADWNNGSNLHTLIATRVRRMPHELEERPYQKYWNEKVVPLMLSWNGKINPCAFRTGAPPVNLNRGDLLAVREFVGAFRTSFLAV